MDEDAYRAYQREYQREYAKRPEVKARKRKYQAEYLKGVISAPTFRADRSVFDDSDFYAHRDLGDAHGTDLGLSTTLRDVGSYLRSGKKRRSTYT
jgi:hypothetical protein